MSAFHWGRRAAALAIVALSIALWSIESDVVGLILRQDQVLFGRYSRQDFGKLLLLTPLLWALALAFWSREPLARALGNMAIGVIVTLSTILLVVYLSSWSNRPPRYVEIEVADDPRLAGLDLEGIVRHRPPGERHVLSFTDQPPHPRSYPDAPPGYGTVDIVLSSDGLGFRNTRYHESYDLLVVGDSFAAGSHVSDEQVWTELLAENLGLRVYNLGVSGSGPRTYLNNFAYLGVGLAPRRALFMIYEGNDFKDDVVPAPVERPVVWVLVVTLVREAFTRWRVTAGLRTLSETVFEPANAGRPVPDWHEQLGFMPVAVPTPLGTHYYSFRPRRLAYLTETVEEFETSEAWRATTRVIDRILRLSAEHGIEPMFVYAPSKPNVVLPLVWEEIPAQQLANFMRWGRRSKPEPDTYKQHIGETLPSQEQVFMDHCRKVDVACLSLVPALRQATASGIQTYFTYDQHWSPSGNRIVAETIADWLRGHSGPEQGSEQGVDEGRHGGALPEHDQPTE